MRLGSRLGVALVALPVGAFAQPTGGVDCPPPETARELEALDTAATIVLAPPVRKAQLLAAALAGDPTHSVHALLQAALDAGEGPAFVRALSTQSGLLERLAGAVLEEEIDLLPELGSDRESALLLAGVFAAEGGDEGLLALHRLLDVARRRGFLDPLIANLRRRYPDDELVSHAIRLAKPTMRPLVVAHRGGPPSPLYPENTLPAIESGLRSGSDAIEIDLSLTRTGEIVLWHDATLGGTVNFARNVGLEPGAFWRPVFPDLISPSRKPIHELDLRTVRREYGYANGDGRSDISIPTLDEVLAIVSTNPRAKMLVLDVKIPSDVEGLPQRFAETLRASLKKYGVSPDRVALIHPDADMVRKLRKELPGFTVTHDLENNTPIPSAEGFDAGLSADRVGSDLASVGLPVLGVDGRDRFLEGIARTRAGIESGRGTTKKLMVWTVNDELTLRETIATGVDAIITDDPAGLARLLDRLGL